MEEVIGDVKAVAR